jgi:peptidyl-prolyl cis-trans isomerase C
MNTDSIIASSNHQDWPRVSINGAPLDPQTIALEMQYHPAETREEAVFLAAQALVIRELLEQRAAYLGVEVIPQADETEEEAFIRGLLEQFYQSNLERFSSAPLVAARHILLAVAPDDVAGRSRVREQAVALLCQLRESPGRFAELAAQYSDCPSREQGGALGQLSSGQTVAEFERQLLRLDEGLASQPLESRYGFHIVLVDQRIEGKQLPFELVSDSIRAELGERVWQKAVVQYIETLIGEAEIEGIVMRGAASPLLQ